MYSLRGKLFLGKQLQGHKQTNKTLEKLDQSTQDQGKAYQNGR